MNYGAPTQNNLHRPNEKYKGIKEFTPSQYKRDLHSERQEPLNDKAAIFSYLVTICLSKRGFQDAKLAFAIQIFTQVVS